MKRLLILCLILPFVLAKAISPMTMVSALQADQWGNRAHPGSLSGLELWLDGTNSLKSWTDTGMGTQALPGANTVGRGANLSLNTSITEIRDAEQTASAQKLVYATAAQAFGSLPGWNAQAGTTQMLSGTFTKSLTALTIVLVMKPSHALDTDDLGIFSLVADKVTAPWSDVKDFVIFRGNATSGGIQFHRGEGTANPLILDTTFDTAAHLWVVTMDHSTTTGKLWKDGGSPVQTDTYSDTTTLAPQFFTVSGGFFYDVPSQMFYGDIMVYSHALTTNELNRVIRPYVQSKYGITVAAFSGPDAAWTVIIILIAVGKLRKKARNNHAYSI